LFVKIECAYIPQYKKAFNVPQCLVVSNFDAGGDGF